MTTTDKDAMLFAKQFAHKEELRGKRILITGATGLIGSTMVRCLNALDIDLEILTPNRQDLAEHRLSDFGHADYIIHCAAPTASRFFVEHPVETFRSIVDLTGDILEYARAERVEGVIYLSSLEVYGSIDNDEPITEDIQGYLNPMEVRSSYPMAKRAAENLCCLYASEYGVPVKIARLTQTTGAGISKEDGRVIAAFTRKATSGEDIILHTTGESARPYLYLTDAIEALLVIMLKGKSGEAYNVANEDTYISARNLAEFIREEINPAISVRIELNDNMGYAPTTHQRLSTGKLQSLGWGPRHSLSQIVQRLAEYLRE